MFKINIINLYGFDKELKEEIEAEKRKIAFELFKIGEAFVNEAKESGAYQDQTTNLRNANSYRVYIDGRVVHESIGRPETNVMFQGMVVPDGIQLVVGNGMNYASFVESKHGLNVVSSGFLLVERKVRELFNK